jgi:hypothetical protein
LILIRQKLINILIVAIFIIGIVFSILPQPVQAAPAPTVIGNTVNITTSDVYIEATPATLTSSGWVEVLFWTRNYDGPVDVVYGFNGLDNVKAVKQEVWEPYEHTKYRSINVVKTLTYTPVSIITHKEKIALTKVPKSDFGEDELNPKYAEIVVTENNTLSSGVIQKTINLAYESTDGKSYTYKKNVQEQESYKETYVDWNKRETPASVTLNHAEAKRWEVASGKSVVKNEIQKVKVWIDIPFKGKDTVTGKYNIGIKPSNLSLQDAKDQGKLWLLDPWYSASWGYRKPIICYGSSIGIQSDYQKKIRIYKGAGTDIAENIAIVRGGITAGDTVHGNNWKAQTFKALSSGTVTKVTTHFAYGGTAAGNIVMSLRATAAGVPTGADLGAPTTALITPVLMSPGGTVRAIWEFNFNPGITLAAGTTYAWVLRYQAGGVGDYVDMSIGTPSGYADGQYCISTDGGVTWGAYGGGAYDIALTQVIASPSATGSVIYCGGKCKDDFTDLRFTQLDGTTLVNHFIESYVSGSYADVWIKLPTIAQLTGYTEGTSYYMYYGNSGASLPDTAQNMGINTFVFFDHFDTTFPGTKWAGTTAGGSIAGSILTYAGAGVSIYSTTNLTSIYYLVGSNAKLLTPGAGTEGFGLSDTSHTLSHYTLEVGTAAATHQAIQTKDGATISELANTWVAADYHIFYTYISKNYYAMDFVDNVPNPNGIKTNHIPNTASMEVSVYSDTANPVYVDWIFLAKYAISSPVWGTAGVEEALLAPTVVTGLCTGTGSNWAIVNGSVTVLANQDGTSFNSTSRGFNYGLTTGYGTNSSTSGSYPIGAFSALLTGLSPATTYHYRAFASVPSITGYGADATFTTTGAIQCHTTYTAADDGNASVYGINWVAQTFTTPAGMPFTVKTVSIKAHKVLAPTGTVTIGIYRATGGLPYGQVLTSGSFASSLLSTSDSWYGVDMTIEYSLESNTTYAIVVSGPTLSATDYIVWRHVAAGGYTGGASSTSANSGSNWVAAAPDQLFTICGNQCLQIQDARVILSYKETNDWLVVVRYINVYPPYYNTYDVKKYFAIQLYETDTALTKASTPLPDYGNKVGSIYLASATTLPLTYGGDYRVRIYGNFTGNPYVEYPLQAMDWLGDDLTFLDSWIRTSATTLETYYSTTLLTDVVGKGRVLNSTGSGIFTAGIIDLSNVRPTIFETSFTKLPMPTTAPNTQALQSHYIWQVAVGPQLTALLTDTGNMLGGITGDYVGAFILLLMWAIVAGLVYPPGHTMAAVMLDSPILIACIWFGFVNLVTMGIMIFIFIFLLLWQFVLKQAG